MKTHTAQGPGGPWANLVILTLLLGWGLAAAQLAYQPLRNIALAPDALAAPGEGSGLTRLAAAGRLDHFYTVEGEHWRYRWSDGRGRLDLANPGGASLARLELAAGPPGPTTVRLEAAGHTASIPVGSAPRIYAILLPDHLGPQITIRLLSDGRRVDGDKRRLGIVLGAVRLSGGGTSPAGAGIMLAALAAGSYTMLRVLQQARPASLLVAFAVTAIAAGWLGTIGWRMPWLATPLIGLLAAPGLIASGLRGFARLAAARVFLPAATAAAGLLLSTPIVAYTAAGTASRFIADDYCYAVVGQALGPLGATAHMYITWSGRYSSAMLAAVLAPLGPAAAPAAPALLLATWLFGLWWAASLALGRAGFSHARVAALPLAASTLTLALGATPNIYQSLLWQTGALTYTAPLAATALFAGWILRAAPGRASPAAILLSLIAGAALAGFSETNAVLSCAALALALIAICLRRPLHRPALALAGSGLAGSLAGLAAVALAPGNQVRQETITAQLGAAEALLAAGRAGYELLTFAGQLAALLPRLDDVPPVLAGRAVAVVLGITAALALGTLLGAAAGPAEPISPGRATLVLALLPIGAWALISASLAPGFYALGEPPPDRALLAAHTIAALATVVAGLAVGCAIPRDLRGALIPALGLLAALAIPAAVGGSLVALSDRTPRIHAYAAAWAPIDQAAQAAAPGSELSVAAPPPLEGLLWLADDRAYWSNVCTAQYYGLSGITAR